MHWSTPIDAILVTNECKRQLTLMVKLMLQHEVPFKHQSTCVYSNKSPLRKQTRDYCTSVCGMFYHAFDIWLLNSGLINWTQISWTAILNAEISLAWNHLRPDCLIDALSSQGLLWTINDTLDAYMAYIFTNLYLYQTERLWRFFGWFVWLKGKRRSSWRPQEA